MRVKAFSHDTAEDLEHAIDAWLAEHPAITIVTAVQSMGRSFAGDRIVLTLFYTEPAQTDETAQRASRERDDGEPALTHQPPLQPRPAMAPPSSGAGRASPLPPDAMQPPTQPPAPGAAQQ